MENTTTSKKEQKQAGKKTNHASVRVSKPTGKAVQTVLEQINRKDFGKNVKPDALIARAMSKLTQQDVKELQESSLSNQDRFERDYASYCAEHGRISKDEYLGKRLAGELAPLSDGASADKKQQKSS